MTLLLLLLLGCNDHVVNVVDCEGLDNDGDGFAGSYTDTLGRKSDACDFAADDCDDADSGIHPGATGDECDGVDVDCDGVVDPDRDGDGATGCKDCDDTDPRRAPSLPEVCDGVDNDCDGVADDGLDADSDGVSVCDGDCDDADPRVYPGAVEGCDGADDDCDGALLDGGESDGDSDGVRECDGDCDDADASRHPGATELCDGIDEDCNDEIDASEVDGDGDGTAGCAGDCDDTDPAVHPGAAELCNGIDDSCDGVTDEGQDADGDGFLPCVDDCDDDDPTVYPGAPELCDGTDEDCDGAIPEDEVDLDGDGWTGCAGDCSPLDAAVSPGAAEQCDGLDDDCDGALGADEVDADHDGAFACDDCDDGNAQENLLDLDRDGQSSCDGDCDDLDAGVEGLDHDGDGVSLCGGDCDDDDAGRSPALAEACNFVDDDCDGAVDEGFVDVDGDGAAECVEICDGLDDDADGWVDEDFIDGLYTGVWVDATAPAGDGSVAHPYSTLQEAVDARSQVDPCPIYVRPGTYFEAVEADGGRVELVSTDGAGLTTIDADGAGAAFYAQSTEDGSRLEGFTLTGGGGTEGGGGVRVEEGVLDVTDDVITGNTLDGGPGAGIYCRDCTGTISGNTISGNLSAFPGFDYGLGAGIAVMYSSAEPVITDNVVTGNVLDSTYGFGAGIGLWGTGEVWIERNLVADNVSSYDGGGIAVRDGSTGYLLNNIVIGNQCLSDDYNGAGVQISNDGGSWLVNNTIALNEGGKAQVAISWSHDRDYVADNLIVESELYGLGSQGGTTPQVVYNDLYGNTLANYDGMTDYTGTNGNFSADPLLVDLSDDGDGTDDDVTLSAGSPAIDAGLTSATFDDPDGTRNDLGAYGGPEAW